LEATDWLPFREVLSQSHSALMVGHVTLTAVDPDRAASHSKRVVQGIVRDKWKYQGVVMTDDLVMGAIYQHDVCKAVVEAINAGVDLLLVAYDGAQFYRIFECALDGSRQGKLDAGNAARERSATGKRLSDRSSASRLRRRRPRPLAFRELPVVRLAMKPEFVTRDALLHGDVVDRLVERDNGKVAHAERDEILHSLVVLRRVRGEPRLVDQRVHLLVLVGGDVEDRVVAVEIPVEVILGIVQPAAEAVQREWQLLLVQCRAPVRAGKSFSIAALMPILARLSWIRMAVGSPTVAVPVSSDNVVSRPDSNPASSSRSWPCRDR